MSIIILTYRFPVPKYSFLISAIFVNLIYAIDSRLLQTTAIKNDHKPFEQFSNTFDNEISTYGSSKLNQFRKYVHPRDAQNLTVNDKKSDNLPYSKKYNLDKVFSICHKCTRARTGSNMHQDNNLEVQHNALVKEQNIELQRLRNSGRSKTNNRIKRETTVKIMSLFRNC